MNLPTAEAFLDNHLKNGKITPERIRRSQIEAMIEFAKLHVEEALKEASKIKVIDVFVRPTIKGSKYKLMKTGESYDILNTIQMFKVNKDSILNAYPLENIK